jgi:chaperonin GroES
MSINYSPLEDRVLLKAVKKNEIETTASGIIIPDTVKKQVCEAEVVAAGDGVYAKDTGSLIPTYVVRGNIVLVGANEGKPNGLEIEIETDTGKETVYILRESDILMIIKKKDKE